MVQKSFICNSFNILDTPQKSFKLTETQRKKRQVTQCYVAYFYASHMAYGVFLKAPDPLYKYLHETQFSFFKHFSTSKRVRKKTFK